MNRRSISRIRSVAERVLRQIWHDKRVLAFMFVVPSLAMLLFGFSFAGDIRGVRMAIIDQDQTDLTASIIDNLQHDSTFSVTQIVTDVSDPQ